MIDMNVVCAVILVVGCEAAYCVALPRVISRAVVRMEMRERDKEICRKQKRKEGKRDVYMRSYGEWLPTHDSDKKRCSVCDVITLIAQYPRGEANFCPNCGAYMRRK